MKHERNEIVAPIVVAFPIARQAQFIKYVAAGLDSRNGRAAERFWLTECDRLESRLQASGLSETDVQNEMRLFMTAVQAALTNKHYRRRNRSGDDAA